MDISHYFQFLFSNIPLFNGIVLLVSMIILFKSADLIVFGISEYAKKLGLSDYLIGLVVVALAASMPEIISALMGLAMNDVSVMFGTILGTNMVHLALVTGLLMIIGKKMKMEVKLLEDIRLFLLVILILPFLLLSDSVLSRADGIILVIAFGAYLVTLWKKEGTLGKIKKKVDIKTFWKDMVVFIGSLMALILAGRYLVFSSIQLANYYGVPSYLLALTVIAVGAALPDFAVGIKSVLKGHHEVGIGEVLGSSVLELVLFFGIVAIIKPIHIDFNTIIVPSIFLVISATYMVWLMKNKLATWKNGLIFLGLYFVFIIIEIVKTIFFR